MTQEGFYTDPPSRRMGFDQDGTVVLYVNQNGADIYELDVTEKQALNDETGETLFLADDRGDIGVSDIYDIVFMFPEKRSVSQIWTVVRRHGAPQQNPEGIGIYWSDDSTNGVDGTWVQSASAFETWSSETANGGNPYTAAAPEYRENLENVSIDSAKCVKFRFRCTGKGWFGDNRFYAFHLYGLKTPGETPHRIDFVNAAGSEFSQDFDFGDQPRGTERIWNPEDGFNLAQPLFLRNRSPEKVAYNVVLSMQAFTKDMHTRLRLSADNGVSWSTTLEFTEIQPLDKTGVIWVRHEVEDDADLGLYAARLKIDVGSWE